MGKDRIILVGDMIREIIGPDDGAVEYIFDDLDNDPDGIPGNIYLKVIDKLLDEMDGLKEHIEMRGAPNGQ